MKYLLRFMAILALFIPALWARSVDELVERVKAYYAGVETIQAKFCQVVYIKAAGCYQEGFRGWVYMERPDKFRLEVKEPEPQVVVGDGKWVWTYLPADSQVCRSPWVQDLFSPLLILEDYTKRFKVEVGAGPEPAKLKLIPYKEGYPFTQIVLELDPQSGEVRAVEVTDGIGNKIRFELAEIRYNQPIPPERFRFTPPPGVEVVELPLGVGGGMGD